MTDVLKIVGVSKSYSRLYIDNSGKRDSETNAVLYDLSLSIPHSKVSALIGGNGAGKTTLFNIICGYLQSDSGEIIYTPDTTSNYNLTKLKPWNTSKIGIGRMFQTPRIFKNLTVIENMMIADEDQTGDNPFISIFGLKKVKIAETKKVSKVEKIFTDLFGLDSKFWQIRDSFAGSLSYGEQRLLSLARLFMNDNLKLILLDEPCAGINIQVIEKISSLLKKITESGKAVLLIEHNIEFVNSTADYTFYLEDGNVKTSGITSEVLNTAIVKENYISYKKPNDTNTSKYYSEAI